jgi:ABC-type transporter Mla subunit MlaD
VSVVVYIATFNSISVLNTNYELRYNGISVGDLDRLRTMPAGTIVAVDNIDK